MANRHLSTGLLRYTAPRVATIVPWLLLGLVVRLCLLPVALHIDPTFGGDILGMNHYAYLLAHQPSSSLPVGPLYPPLAYHTMSLFQALFRPFSPPLLPPSAGPEAWADWLVSTIAFRQLFFLKVWYLLFDFGAAFLLWRLFRPNRDQARRALGFWVLNPILLYNAYFHGQFDVVPLFFTTLALFLARRTRPTWAALAIGLAACYKNYAFFFLPPALLILTQSSKERLRMFLVGTVPYLLFLIPRLTAYQVSISGYSEWFFKVGYDVGLGGRIYVFLAVYAALLWYLSHYRAHSVEYFWRACLAILLVYYQLSYFDLHYWAWILPFAAIYWVERPREAGPFYLVIGACLLVLTASTPVARFLAPLSPRFFLRLPSLLEALSPYLPMLFLLNVVRSVLAGTCFYLAWRLLRDRPAADGRPVGAIPGVELA